MLGVNYFKADPSTFVIKSVKGNIKQKGRGLSFFYNAVTSSIVSVPVNTQEAPFIIGLQTADFQEVRVQGQITFKIDDPVKAADQINYVLNDRGEAYISEDPMKMPDRIIQVAQGIAQEHIQMLRLKEALPISVELATEMKARMDADATIDAMGVKVLKTFVMTITPTPETKQALEAEAREAILKEADDAIYARRKSSVEQERTIREAELQTEHDIQQKEQEIEESKIENERVLLRGRVQTDAEKLEATIDSETKRKSLVLLAADNTKEEADAEAYAIAAKMKALSELPVENLKAIAMSKMQPDQVMALAFEALAQNAGKIGELNITPDLFGQFLKKEVRDAAK